jgi:effector-binding domain-containing protein
MKKWLVLFFILCAASLTILYFNIPVTNSFSKTVYIKTNINGAGRFLFDENKWIKWWPTDLQNNLAITNSKNNQDNYSYSLDKKMYGSMNIAIKKNETEFIANVNLISLDKNSVEVIWSCLQQPAAGSIARIRNYFYSKTLEKNAIEILASLKSFLEKNENIYGINIRQIMVTDTLLIATKYTSATYPTTPVIYDLIQKLKKYIALNNARETNPPMLHIIQDSGYFKTMVAIPVDKVLPGDNNFLLKRMVPGKILVTQVKGGIHTTSEALKQLEIYIDDNHLSSPAISFESLITNRIEEPDTSKWETKIYYPIF